MLTFDLIVGLALIKQMLRDRIRQMEEKKKLKIKRKAVLSEQGHITLEESIKLPRFRYRTLVVLSARGIGRRQVIQSLVHKHPEMYGIPTLHTSRAPRHNEVIGSRFTFVTRQQMMLDFRENRFLEYGVHNNQSYGIKFDSIRSIIRDGKLALLEVEPLSLRHLRNPEFAPFVVFIAPPLLHNVEDFDGSLTQLMNESAQMHRDYAHLIDMTIVMNDMGETIQTLEVVLEDIQRSPQWVPLCWVRGHR